MYLTNMYKIETEEGYVKITGNLPENIEPLETLVILNAEENMELVRVSDNKTIGNNIWLKDNDTQDNYIEVEIKEDKTNLN